jgi:hypothetical protein
MFEADQKLACHAKGVRANLGLHIPHTPKEALEVAEELLTLMREEAITNYSLSGMYVSREVPDSLARYWQHHSYRDCATYSLACGFSGKAVKYANKELEVERYCIGTETAHLEQDMRGADFWLPYVMSEHVKIERVKVQEKQRAEVMLQKGNAAEKSGKAKGKKGWWTVDRRYRLQRCLREWWTDGYASLMRGIRPSIEQEGQEGQEGRTLGTTHAW